MISRQSFRLCKSKLQPRVEHGNGRSGNLRVRSGISTQRWRSYGLSRTPGNTALPVAEEISDDRELMEKIVLLRTYEKRVLELVAL